MCTVGLTVRWEETEHVSLPPFVLSTVKRLGQHRKSEKRRSRETSSSGGRPPYKDRVE